MRPSKLKTFLLPLALLLTPTVARPQAWTPPRGELYLGLTYQWLKAENHLFTNDVLGPERTPVEEAFDFDLDSTKDPTGQIRSQLLVLDADLGVTDHLAISGGLAFVQSIYLGDFPDDPAVDDGTYHGNFQDARIGARYFFNPGGGSWALTPFASYVFPATDYPVLGHVAIGRGLSELQVGFSWGRLLNLGSERAYVSGEYFYAFMENPSETVQLDRSNLQLEFGYIHRSMTLQIFGVYQNTHGGINWALDFEAANPEFDHIVSTHDQGAASDYWRFGGALSFQVTEAVDLYAAFNNTLWGINTHDARTVTFGMSWGFQAFGGLGRTLSQDDGKGDREDPTEPGGRKQP